MPGDTCVHVCIHVHVHVCLLKLLHNVSYKLLIGFQTITHTHIQQASFAGFSNRTSVMELM